MPSTILDDFSVWSSGYSSDEEIDLSGCSDDSPELAVLEQPTGSLINSGGTDNKSSSFSRPAAAAAAAAPEDATVGKARDAAEDEHEPLEGLFAVDKSSSGASIGEPSTAVGTGAQEGEGRLRAMVKSQVDLYRTMESMPLSYSKKGSETPAVVLNDRFSGERSTTAISH